MPLHLQHINTSHFILRNCTQGSQFSVLIKSHDFSIFPAFFTNSKVSFLLFHVAQTPFESWDSDLKSTKPWFSYFLEIFSDLKYIGSGLKNKIFPQHYSVTIKKLKTVLTITEILIFLGFLSFFHIFYNLKIPWYFHDLKSYSHFPRFSRCCGNSVYCS